VERARGVRRGGGGATDAMEDALGRLGGGTEAAEDAGERRRMAGGATERKEQAELALWRPPPRRLWLLLGSWSSEGKKSKGRGPVRACQCLPWKYNFKGVRFPLLLKHWRGVSDWETNTGASRAWARA
jgi:hypothetical protein